LLVIAPAVLVFCLLLTGLFRRRRAAAAIRAAAPSRRSPDGAADGPTMTATATRTQPGRLARFGLFWYDFVIGDDWQIAAGVAAALIVTALAAGWSAAWLIAAVAVALLIPYGTARAARS
jgi:hypothetical protein